jgi:flavin-dependent dehydrogenase
LGVKFDAGEGRSFRGISFVQAGARVSADFPHGQGVGLRRPLLHERLVAVAEEFGVKLMWKTPVSGIDADGVRISSGLIRARWIVGADGHGSRVLRWSGLAPTAPSQQRYANRRHYRLRPWSNYMEIYWGSRAQAYVTPIASDEVCIVIMAETTEHASFDSALAEMPELNEKLAGAQPSSRERGAVTAMRSLQRVQRNHVALVGDASGGVDAITGEGLRLAFRQAFALADAMAAGNLINYQQAHREIARRPMFMGNLLLWLARHPRIRARVIRVMQDQPDLFARLLTTHVGEGSYAQLLSTGALLGLRILAI